MRVAAGKSTTMLIVLGVLIGPFACAPRVAPPSNTVRRIAVLPPCDATGGPLGGRGTSVTTYEAPVESRRFPFPKSSPAAASVRLSTAAETRATSVC